MMPKVGLRRIFSIEALPRTVGLFAVLAGSTVLTGWIFNVPLLSSFFPGFLPMKVNAAVCFVFSGLSLYCLVAEKQNGFAPLLGKVSACVVILISTATLGEYLWGGDLGIDQLLVRDVAGAASPYPPGRMAVAAALSFSLAGAALLLLNKPRAFLWVQGAAVAIVIIGGVGFINYLYGIKQYYGIASNYINLALNAALLLVVLALGILSVHPERSFMKFAIGHTASGQMLRRFLPILVGLPVFGGWLVLRYGAGDSQATPFEMSFFVVSMVGVFTTLLFSTASELYRGEARFKLAAIVESSADAIFTKTLNSLVQSWNKGAEQTYGYSDEEVLGKTVFLLMPHEVAADFCQRVHKVERQAVVERFEAVHLKKDGSRIDVSLTLSPVKDATGKIAGVSIISRDITERRRNEKKLRELSRAVEQSPVSILITDARGDITYVNPKFSQLTGYSFEEVMGKNPRILKGGDQPAAFYKKLWATLLAGKEWRGEFHNKKKNGEFYWESASISPLSDVGGRLSHFIAVKEDVTERRRLEMELKIANEKLKELDQRKSAFVANVSHELKNPLAIIRESTALLLDRFAGEVTPEQKEILEMGKRSTERLIRLVSNLLDLAQIESGKIELKRESLDPGVLLGEVLKNYEREISKKRLRLLREIPSAAGSLSADRDKLTEVIINLLNNAIKYTPEGGQIIVRLEGDEREIRFEMADSGPGIPEDQREKIFDKFTRITAEKQEGTGLGLPIAREIVELHKGRMWVESGMGGGSRFIFTMPRNSRE